MIGGQVVLFGENRDSEIGHLIAKLHSLRPKNFVDHLLHILITKNRDQYLLAVLVLQAMAGG